MKSNQKIVAQLLLVLLLAGCNGTNSRPVRQALACDPDNGGITLPEGFCALVVADNIGRARHLVVRNNGDIYVALRRLQNGHGIAALRDTSGDGRADIIAYFGEVPGTGIDIRDGYLYFAPDTALLRYRLVEGELLPQEPPELVVGGLPERRQHAAKPFAFDEAGYVYINIGAPSNACQSRDRQRGVPGMDPCPLLERYGGIWRFRADVLGQRQDDGLRYATGIRNAVAIAWNPFAAALYVVQHGRDQLNTLWPEYFDAEDNANLPAEEFFRVDEGDDFGWPYCYYDPIQNKKVLAPEYGGDGRTVGRCAQFEDPIVAYPAHWAPNDLIFYDGTQFPERYRGGAFIAFHGSWNRAPLPQAGYNVVFQPMNPDGTPAGDWEVFADGFAGTDQIRSTGDAKHRPMGLAIGPDGSLYISDSVRGRIWRVIYRGR